VREVRMGRGKRSMMVAPKMLAPDSRARASWMVEREDMMWGWVEWGVVSKEKALSILKCKVMSCGRADRYERRWLAVRYLLDVRYEAQDFDFNVSTLSPVFMWGPHGMTTMAKTM